MVLLLLPTAMYLVKCFIGHIPEVHYVSTVENHPQNSNGIRLRRIILETECAKIVQQRESQICRK